MEKEQELSEKVKDAFARGFLQGCIVLVTAYLVYFLTLCVALGIAVWQAPKLLGIAFIGKATLTIAALAAAASFWLTLILGFFGKAIWRGISLGVTLAFASIKAVFSFIFGIFKKKKAENVYDMRSAG